MFSVQCFDRTSKLKTYINDFSLGNSAILCSEARIRLYEQFFGEQDAPNLNFVRVHRLSKQSGMHVLQLMGIKRILFKQNDLE